MKSFTFVSFYSCQLAVAGFAKGFSGEEGERGADDTEDIQPTDNYTERSECSRRHLQWLTGYTECLCNALKDQWVPAYSLLSSLQVKLSCPADGVIRIGDAVCLLHPPTQSVLSAYMPAAQAHEAKQLVSGCYVACSKRLQPCPRNVFIIGR